MKINLANIKKAIKHLNKNECVAIPTETVYGLSGNAYSNKACEKIFRLKKRPKDNPLIVHYYNNIQLRKDCNFDNRFLDLYKKFCPGPITFVLNLHKNSKISKIATNKRNSLAIRFPKHPVTRALLKKLKFPLAAPSANLSSKVSAVRSIDVKEDFGNKIKYILEGGKSKIGLESTIIDLRKEPKILRVGGLEISNIEKVLNQKVKINQLLAEGDPYTLPIIAEKDGFINYVDLKQGISFRESIDDTTGISSKIVIDWSQNPKSKNFKPAINIVNLSLIHI